MKGSDRDAARTWHGLDSSLEKLREAVPGFEEAGREDLLEHLEELMEKAEAGRAEAESEVTRLLGDRRRKTPW